MLDGLSSAVVGFLISVLQLLPESPFLTVEELEISEFYEWIRFLNWFVPFGTFVQITGVWLTGVGIYYVYQIVFRWLKLIE